MAGLTIARLRFSPGLLALGGLCTVMTLAILLALFHLGGLASTETNRATTQGQRAIIDPVSGEVTLAEPGKKLLTKATTGFDVATEEESRKARIAADTTQVASTGERLPEGLPVLRTTPLSTKLPETNNPLASLVPAPAPEISEQVEGLVLPRRGDGPDETPALIYARHFKAEPGQHRLSIVISGAGISAQSIPLIMALPKDVTVAFSPYALDVTTQINTLRSAGYEVWSDLPAMTARFPQDDPGPLGLVATLPKEELIRRLHTVMGVMIGSVGMILPDHEVLTAKHAVFSALSAEIDARGLALLSAQSAQVNNDGIRHADAILDPIPDETAIKAALAVLNASIATQEHLIVVTSARPQTLVLLQRWFKEHPLETPAVLAPLSAQFPGRTPPPPVEEPTSGGHGGSKEESSGGHH